MGRLTAKAHHPPPREEKIVGAAVPRETETAAGGAAAETGAAAAGEAGGAEAGAEAGTREEDKGDGVLAGERNTHENGQSDALQPKIRKETMQPSRQPSRGQAAAGDLLRVLAETGRGGQGE
ncbi:unnamed protein product, partial [Ectocarpus sp. 4 AP-2014]